MSDLKEHSPLSRFDELPLHQSNEPLRLVATTDPRAFERYWFTAQSDDGEIFIVTGIGAYANVGTVDAFAMIIMKGEQTTVRAHRLMGQDRSDLHAGPFSFELIAPFREWRLKLQDCSLGFSFDLRWCDTKRAVFRRLGEIVAPGVMDFRLLHNWCGYETFGRISGTVKYRETVLEIDPARTRGSRDHHWGTRDDVGGHALDHSKPFQLDGQSYGPSHLGQWVEFKDFGIWGDRVLYGLGDPQPGATPMEPVEQKLRFDPITRHLIGGVVINRLSTGELLEVHYEQIGLQTAYLRAGMYTGCNGLGTPNGDVHHGMNVGERVDGETFDLKDPKTRIRIAGFEDHLMKATCNGESSVGILECRNPAIYAMASKGIRYSLL